MARKAPASDIPGDQTLVFDMTLVSQRRSPARSAMAG